MCIMGDLSFEILSPSLISHWQFVPRESIFINLRKMRSGSLFKLSNTFEAKCNLPLSLSYAVLFSETLWMILEM